MRSRGALYVGVLLILLGGLFLLMEVGSTANRWFHLQLGWGRLWPLFICFASLAFWLPILVWWPQHEKLAGLAIPATIVGTNGLILLYQSLSGNWGTWAYLWTLEPISVAVGLLCTYLIGERNRGLLLASGIVGGVGLFFFAIFSTAFGGFWRVLLPAVLIVIGLYLLLRGASRGQALD